MLEARPQTISRRRGGPRTGETSGAVDSGRAATGPRSSAVSGIVTNTQRPTTDRVAATPAPSLTMPYTNGARADALMPTV